MNSNLGSGSGQTSESASSYSGRSPDEIEREIDDTRERLSQTLDALQHRLSPRERIQAATDSAREMGGRFMHSASSAMTPDITTMIRMDHTHVLALFRRFRPATSMSRKEAIVQNACLALEVHARLEEEIFYPALRAVVGQNEVLDRSEPEHNEMRNLISALRSMQVGDPAFDDTFRMLIRTVLHHVADEETVLLPLAEEAMPERLGDLGMRMTKRRVELLRPHLGEVAATTARSFPVGTAAVAAGVLAMGWMVAKAVIRPNRH